MINLKKAKNKTYEQSKAKYQRQFVDRELSHKVQKKRNNDIKLLFN